MTKRERLQRYRELYPKYDITNIKTMTPDNIRWYESYGEKSLDELYKKPSNAKRQAWQWIMDTYKPEILAVQGNSMTFSVLLRASSGQVLHITRSNNYIVEIQE